MAEERGKLFHGVLDPADRISEVLFGLIMVLISTGTLSVLTAGKAEVRTMIVSALGCNVAWGIIDAGMYLMACLDERGRTLLALQAIHRAHNQAEARRAVADALPPSLADVLTDAEIEPIRRRLAALACPPTRPRLTSQDILGAVAVGAVVALTTLPVVLPFLFFEQVLTALRISNAIAIAMLFLCGYAFARCTGLRPWLTGLLMVAVGALLVAVAVVLGG
jgi:VIT family